jgi:hypothetical protein
VTLLERLMNLCVAASPEGYCFRCAAELLEVSQHEIRDSAQLLVPPAGTYLVDSRPCARCRELTDVLSAE